MELKRINWYYIFPTLGSLLTSHNIYIYHHHFQDIKRYAIFEKRKVEINRKSDALNDFPDINSANSYDNFRLKNQHHYLSSASWVGYYGLKKIFHKIRIKDCSNCGRCHIPETIVYHLLSCARYSSAVWLSNGCYKCLEVHQDHEASK